MPRSITLHSGTTAPGTGDIVEPRAPEQSIIVSLTGDGAVSATVQLECSNDEATWCVDSGFPQTISGTDAAKVQYKVAGGSRFARLNVTAIAGTDAELDAVYGEV